MSEENSVRISTQGTPNPVQANAQKEVNPMYAGEQEQVPNTAEQALNPEAAAVAAERERENPYKQADAEFAKKFAALSRKEREIQETMAKLKEQQAQIAELEQRYKTETNLKEQLKYNPLKALEEAAGYKFEDLTKFAMNGGDVTPEMKIELMRRELEAKFEDKLKGLETKYEEDERRKAEEQQAAAKQGFMEEINVTVSTTQDEDGTLKYELIAANEASDLVYDVVEQHYQETGKILDIEEAADEVERYLEEELKKHTKLKKFGKIFQPQDPQSKQVPAPGQGSPTLSNDLASQSPVRKTKLSNEESLAEAAKLLRWND